MPTRRLAPSATLLVLLCLSSAALGAAPGLPKGPAQGPVLTSDLLHWKTATQIDVSRDGKAAVYVVEEMGRNEKGDYTYFRRLWLADLAGHQAPRELTHGERSDGSPVFSPDARRIAFVRAQGGKPQVWVLPLDGGEAWAATDAPYGAAQPRWSPDGKRLLYSSDLPMHAIEGDLPWAYERPGRSFRDEPNYLEQKDEKELEQRQAARRPEWESAGGAGEKADAEAAGGKAEPKVEPRPDGGLAEIRAWLAQNASEANPRVLDRLDLQGENDLDPEPSFAHLFVVDAVPGAQPAQPTQLTHGFQDFGVGAWAPDGSRIVCASVASHEHPDRMIESDVWVVRPDGSGQELLFHQPGWLIGQPAFSPDGKTLAVLATEKDPGPLTYSQSHLATLPAGGGELRWLTRDFDRDAGDLVWSGDGRWLYFIAPSEGAFPLFRVPATGGEVETVVGGPRGVIDYAAGGGRVVYSLTEPADPDELYVLEDAAHDGRAADAASAGRRLTALHTDWLAERRLATPTEHWLTRPDGTRIQYWIIEPLGRPAGVKVPMVLEMHGGPSAMWGPGELTMWQELQLLASWGYGIVYANPRGSGGYGHDFQAANFRDWGTSPMGDVLAALDEAVKLDWVDRDQLFLTGGSYAGYLTAWIVTQDHRFKAAVAQRGVYDLSFFFGEANAWRLVPWEFGGYPWQREARPSLDANSPLTFVEQVTTPLLIIHSDKDLRTGTGESETLFKSLKVLGRPVEYVRYPDEGHELSRSGNPKRRMDRLDRILEFFERYVKHPAGTGDPVGAGTIAGGPR